MELFNILQSIGLNEKEAKVYLALLQLGQDTVFNISKKAELKRPTVYLILDSLVDKGLASILKTPKATLYSATSPRKLTHQIKEQEANLDKILPTLESIYNLEPHKPKIQIFQGVNGLKTVYTEIIKSLKPGKEVLAYGTIDHLYRPGSIYKEITELWFSQSSHKGYRIREAINDSEYSKKYLKDNAKKNNPNHQIRFLAKGMEFDCDNIIYGNKLAIFSVEKDLFVIVIESEQIVNAYRKIFQSLWQSTRKA